MFWLGHPEAQHGADSHTALALGSQRKIKTSQDDATAPVNVRHGPRSVGLMSHADWAETTARKLLAVPLPRRWAHSQGVAATAQTLAPVLGDNADMLIAAAWLHDVGYAP